MLAENSIELMTSITPLIPSITFNIRKRLRTLIRTFAPQQNQSSQDFGATIMFAMCARPSTDGFIIRYTPEGVQNDAQISQSSLSES